MKLGFGYHFPVGHPLREEYDRRVKASGDRNVGDDEEQDDRKPAAKQKKAQGHDSSDSSSDSDTSTDSNSDKSNSSESDLSVLSEDDEFEKAVVPPPPEIIKHLIFIHKKAAGKKCPHKKGVDNQQTKRIRNSFIYGLAAWVAYFCITGEKHCQNKSVDELEQKEEIRHFVCQRLGYGGDSKAKAVAAIMRKNPKRWMDHCQNRCCEGTYDENGEGDFGIYIKYKKALRECGIHTPKRNDVLADKAAKDARRRNLEYRSRQQGVSAATSLVGGRKGVSPHIQAALDAQEPDSPLTPSGDSKSTKSSKYKKLHKKNNKKKRKGHVGNLDDDQVAAKLEKQKKTKK